MQQNNARDLIVTTNFSPLCKDCISVVIRDVFLYIVQHYDKIEMQQSFFIYHKHAGMHVESE